MKGNTIITNGTPEAALNARDILQNAVTIKGPKFEAFLRNAVNAHSLGAYLQTNAETKAIAKRGTMVLAQMLDDLQEALELTDKDAEEAFVIARTSIEAALVGRK